MKISFRDWLDSAPYGAGEIWSSFSNADSEFGQKGVKSKHFSNSLNNEPAPFDPDKLFLGKRKKKEGKTVNNLTQGDIHGTNNG